GARRGGARPGVPGRRRTGRGRGAGRAGRAGRVGPARPAGPGRDRVARRRRLPRRRGSPGGGTRGGRRAAVPARRRGGPGGARPGPGTRRPAGPGRRRARGVPASRARRRGRRRLAVRWPAAVHRPRSPAARRTRHPRRTAPSVHCGRTAGTAVRRLAAAPERVAVARAPRARTGRPLGSRVMTCGPHTPTFRLLDAYVGWDPAEAHGIVGLRDAGGLRLAGSGGDRQVLLPWFPDRRLAPAWYLATASGVLRRDPCGGGFVPVGPPGCAPEPPVDAPVAVAASGHWLAVAQAGGVRVWWREGEQLLAVVPFPRPGVIALAPDGGLYVAAEAGTDLWRYRPGGAPAGVVHTGLPGRVEGLRVDRHRGLWLLTEDSGGLHVWHAAGPARAAGVAGAIGGWAPASPADPA